MIKKFFSVAVLAAVLIFVGNNSANAQDVYVGNRANGDTVYLMTDSIKKTPTGYSQQWKMYHYECYMTFKAVDSRNKPFFFGYTISWGPEEIAGYKDSNGNWYSLEGRNTDPDVYRAKILERAYEWLDNNGYI